MTSSLLLEMKTDTMLRVSVQRIINPVDARRQGWEKLSHLTLSEIQHTHTHTPIWTHCPPTFDNPCVCCVSIGRDNGGASGREGERGGRWIKFAEMRVGEVFKD